MSGTIVHVDVRPDLPEGLERELGSLGFRLLRTADLDEAFAWVRDGTARLLMLEALIEDGGGWHLIRRIRGLEGPRSAIPVVVLTRAERTPGLVARAEELGADELLERPARRAEILDAILGRVEARGAAPRADPLRSGAEASGSLEELPLPELLLYLREAGATGVLFLQDFEELAVQLQGGAPVAVGKGRGNETFADFLMRTKRISGDEHEALLERAHASGESEAEAAVSIRALSRRDVREALADSAAEPLLEAFAWTGGSWRFEHDGKLRSGRKLARDAVSVLARGVVQWSASRSIRAMLDRRGALYLARAAHPPCTLEALPPLACEPEQLDDWQGDETVAQVLDSGVIGERELYALLVAGLVETCDRSPLVLRDVADAGDEDEESFDLEVDDLCEPLEAPARREVAPRARPLRPRAPPAPAPTPPAKKPQTRPGVPRPAAPQRPGLLARLRGWWRR